MGGGSLRTVSSPLIHSIRCPRRLISYSVEVPALIAFWGRWREAKEVECKKGCLESEKCVGSERRVRQPRQVSSLLYLYWNSGKWVLDRANRLQ